MTPKEETSLILQMIEERTFAAIDYGKENMCFMGIKKRKGESGYRATALWIGSPFGIDYTTGPCKETKEEAIAHLMSVHQVILSKMDLL